MLVLTRRAGQSIMIGTDIVVTVLEVGGEAVRIGIQAPSDVAVHREEVFLVLREANEAAAVSPSADLSALRGRKPPAPPPAGAGGS